MDLFKLILLSVFIFESQSAEYTYVDTQGPGNTGPSAWGGDCNLATSIDQSPIDVVYTFINENMPSFNFANYNETGTFASITNNGHTIQVDMGNTHSVTLNGGGLVGGNNKQYKLAQFHFHWGADSMSGSEHYINGKKYPLEVHFVHYDTSKGGILDAINKTNGLAVLGFMFEVSSQDNPALGFLINVLSNVQNKDQTHTLTSTPSIDSMLGNVDRSRFYRYSGSLTTPGCFESVQWTVFEGAIPISENQLAEIRKMKADTTGTNDIGLNYRPIQKTNGRRVTVSFKPDTSDATLVFINVPFLLTSLLISFMY